MRLTPGEVLSAPLPMTSEPWLAVGVILPPAREPRLRTAHNLSVPSVVAWRFVVSAGLHRARNPPLDPYVLPVPCPDGEDVKQHACFCKTTHWFRR